MVLRIGERELLGVTLQGFVVGPSGEVVTAFQVFPLPVDDQGAPGASHAYPFEDEHGPFEIQGLEASRLMILVRAAGFDDTVLDPADYSDGVHQLTIAMSPTDR